MQAIKNLKARKQEIMDEIKRNAQSALKEAFTEFFEANPDVRLIAWSQYTPYFNDGDVCQFSVNSFCSPKDDKQAEQYLAGELSVYDLDEHWQSGSPVGTFAKDVIDNDIFEAAFGDHVEVVATREGFKVAEYNHD